ncbi:hypothetical protein MNV_330045 [Candidatus Methanoperedens nitroreducens]|uniref:Uncharacterized protein n=1 Tax=Candidatus Methanoperedens nitratireducens TaxID=1392998 RepID=A0A284VQC7_9EURY|nr:hypothetical protein MNV_330045 [Candidatus Methanoperedens nitroreducens]
MNHSLPKTYMSNKVVCEANGDRPWEISDLIISNQWQTSYLKSTAILLQPTSLLTKRTSLNTPISRARLSGTV